MPDTATVNLTNCDREPIHIPGSVQPHGCLLACDDAFTTIHRHSENAAAMLGFEAALIGAPLTKLFDKETLHGLSNAPAQARDAKRPGLLLNLTLQNGRAFDVAAHRFKGSTILEFEPAGPDLNPLDTFRTLIAATTRDRPRRDAEHAPAAASRRVRLRPRHGLSLQPR